MALRIDGHMIAVTRGAVPGRGGRARRVAIAEADEYGAGSARQARIISSTAGPGDRRLRPAGVEPGLDHSSSSTRRRIRRSPTNISTATTGMAAAIVIAGSTR